MEPKTQVEIQLGHMCNNRCVFCVSGQETAFGRARPLEADPILASLDRAYADGHRKVTLLGGEPTLQPTFKRVVAHAVSLGFEEIVVFTNGVKTARAGFIEDVLETRGNFTWRISIQGATEESHDRTTRRRGSFQRILRSMGHLVRLNQRIAINMCVVRSNFESVRHFPDLLREYGASHLHLDMVRPMDAGKRSDEEHRAMIPKYTDLVPALEAMIAGFPDGFDVNIGNLPYCVAPQLASWIHHDGETTYTVSVDGANALSDPWNKYAVKRRDKSKPATCSACVFDARCNGVFDKYREIYGISELVPVTDAGFAEATLASHSLAARLAEAAAALSAWAPPAPFTHLDVHTASADEIAVRLSGPEPLEVVLRAPGGGAGSFDTFGIALVTLPRDRDLARLGLAALWSKLASAGRRVLHPVGVDAIRGEVSTAISKRLARLRATAPHGGVEWRTLDVSSGGSRAELGLATASGAHAIFWLEERTGAVTAGYDFGAGTASPELVTGLRAMMSALSPRLPLAESVETAHESSP
jgi:MoaA/NifB/PqqE/SkfB family radical SAM enzyme